MLSLHWLFLHGGIHAQQVVQIYCMSLLSPGRPLVSLFATFSSIGRPLLSLCCCSSAWVLCEKERAAVRAVRVCVCCCVCWWCLCPCLCLGRGEDSVGRRRCISSVPSMGASAPFHSFPSLSVTGVNNGSRSSSKSNGSRSNHVALIQSKRIPPLGSRCHRAMYIWMTVWENCLCCCMCYFAKTSALGP